MTAEISVYGINRCVHSGSIGQTEDMIQLAIKHGATRVSFLRLSEIGRLAATRKNWSAGQSTFCLV